MDVAGWLRQLGFERYELTFRENDITAAILPSLTADDLKDLGVTSVGHRRQLLDSIAALRGDTSQHQPTTQTGSMPNDRVATPSAERRQLSVMFCDLVGFTELASRLDPEDLSGVIRGYQDRVAAIIGRFNGFIARYVGDGVLIYFGWPTAHEANAERAVRAALEVTEAIVQAPVRTEQLHVRIGIATGVVVVGEPIGRGEARQQTAVGETPNLAARLQALAEPNGILIDTTTRRQIGDLFVCRHLGKVPLKGLLDLVPIWRVLREAAVESRFEALHARTMTPLIGRDEELNLLLRRWQQAKNGMGQLILLVGEPGIGKSRLIAALEERLCQEAHESLRYFCSPHHQDSALYPIVSRWENDLHFSRGDTPPEKWHKLAAALSGLGASREDAVLLADLLSVSTDDSYPRLDFSPQRKKEKTFEALLDLLVNRAHRQPVLMLFEDAHWADASSLELLNNVVERLNDLPILLLISFRPEFQPPWLDLEITSLIPLRRLTQGQAEQLAQRVIVKEALSPDLLDRIVVQTDGVPLFIEELTKAVLERVGQRGSSAATLEVPATLQSSLIARLDRIPAAKHIAQVGAVIGREFAHQLLVAVANTPEPQFAHGIEALISSGLASRHGSQSDTIYTFKHALVRDAAYSTLLRSQRQELHAGIVSELEAHFPDVVETQPELLAHHCTQAGLTERAVGFLRAAGLRSVARSAHAEAAAHFTSAIELLETLPKHKRCDTAALDLTLNLAVPLIALHGFGSLRVEECALKTIKLSERLPGSPSRFAAHRVAWNSCLMRGPLPRTLQLARDLVKLADEEKSPPKIAEAYRALGYSLLIMGEVCEAGELLARGAAIADSIADCEFAVYGEHPSVVCRIYCGQAKMAAGFPDSAVQLLEAAVAIARRQDNAHSLAWALNVAAHVFTIQNEAATAVRFASEALATAHEHNMSQWIALGERCKGWAMHRLGHFETGLDLLVQGIKRWNDTGAKLHTTHCELALADCLLREGKLSIARVHLDAARSHYENYGEAYMAAELDLLEALLLQREHAAPETVERHLVRSLDTARRQSARLFELRSATAFAEFLAARGECGRAIDILAPVYHWFSEGLDTGDLREAKSLLDALM